jgi:hypothetical protein
MSNPTTDEFWRLERILFQQEFVEPLLDIIMRGVELGLDSLPPQLSILADWDVINQDALKYLNSDQLSMLRDILETTRKQVVNIVQDWVLSGEPKTTLDKRLTPIFGSARAARIAATEVTRMYAEGNMVAWRSTGVVTGKRWQTARDERVCPLCGPLHGTIVELSTEFTQSPSVLANSPQVRALFGKDATPEMIYNRASSLLKGSGASVKSPPRHVGCRCWIQPIVSAAALGDKIRGILGRYEAELYIAQVASFDGGLICLR